jgi:Flp pilus assembly protein TadG
MPRLRPARDGQSGGTVVEFAIVLPLFCAMMFGTIDFGWYLYQKFTLAAAVQAGVRSALSITEAETPGPGLAAEQFAVAELGKGGAIAAADVVWTPIESARLSGSKPTRALTLTGTYTFKPLIGFVKMPSTTLSYTATMLLDAQNADI